MDFLMPIRAKPYLHQQEAFEFACRLFGLILGGDSPTISNSVAYLMEMGRTYRKEPYVNRCSRRTVPCR